MKSGLLALVLLFAAAQASAGCSEKRSRDVSFVELAVPDGAKRPAGVEDFRFIDDTTTFDQLVAKVGPPDASQGTRISVYIWCFADGTELMVGTRDRVTIESVRHAGKVIYKPARKKPAK
jgi:hypothetical protein